MKIDENIVNLVKKEKTTYLLVLIFFIILFSIIYLSVPKTLTLDDPYFHIKYAKMIRERGLEVVNNFQWVYYTEQARSGARYFVSLFHFILIPFTYFKEFRGNCRLD